jgi:hypothetical protein
MLLIWLLPGMGQLPLFEKNSSQLAGSCFDMRARRTAADPEVGSELSFPTESVNV